MQSLEKRIAALESVRGTDMQALSDEALETWIAEVKAIIALEKADEAVIPQKVCQ